ncbi:MAG: tetratricopeptide repeat protein, partial [Nodosilinea sp.]
MRYAKALLPLILPLVTLAAPGLAAAPAPPPGDTLLDSAGQLEEGDTTLEDGSLYDLYTVTGQAGQTLAITLESLDLNTFLIVNDGQGNELARNNDIDTAAGNYHSFAVVTLPQGGEVRIVVKGFKVSARGRYRLRVQSADGTAQPQLSEAALMWVEANRLLEQGIQQSGLSQWREALQSYEQALVIYRDIKDRDGEARTLNNIGLVNRSQGNYSAALGYYEQALAITRDIKDRAFEARTLRNIGLVNWARGDY